MANFANDSTDRLREFSLMIQPKKRTRGEGVQKPGNFANVINGCPLMQTCVSIPLQVGIFVSNTPAWEMERSRLSITEILCLNIILMVVFSFVASLMADWAKSKPLIGFGGLFSAALATMSGFGFCCYVGVEFISLVRIWCYSALEIIFKSLLDKS